VSRVRLLALFAVAMVLALTAAACGGDADDGGDDAPAGDDITDSADTVIALEVRDGDLVGGSRQENVSLGDAVEVVVTGDSTDQVHVHGYDLFVDLTDGEGSLTFDALIPGTFEIELEGSGRLLVRMTVS
jgi:hypothetical protein